jgi:hypothetical protein
LFPGDQADGAEHPKPFDTVYLIKAEDFATKRWQRIVRLGEKVGMGEECVFSFYGIVCIEEIPSKSASPGCVDG